MKGQMEGCCNGEWGGERGRLVGTGLARKCMRHPSYSRMHKCSLFHSCTCTHILIGFGCFLDNGIAFSRIRGGTYALVFSAAAPAHLFSRKLVYFGVPLREDIVPARQEVVTFHVLGFFFLACAFSFLRRRVESRTRESLGGPRRQRVGALVTRPFSHHRSVWKSADVIVVLRQANKRTAHRVDVDSVPASSQPSDDKAQFRHEHAAAHALRLLRSGSAFNHLLFTVLFLSLSLCLCWFLSAPPPGECASGVRPRPGFDWRPSG